MHLSHADDRAVGGGFRLRVQGSLGQGFTLLRLRIGGFRLCGPAGRYAEAMLEYNKQELRCTRITEGLSFSFLLAALLRDIHAS